MLLSENMLASAVPLTLADMGEVVRYVPQAGSLASALAHHNLTTPHAAVACACRSMAPTRAARRRVARRR